MKERISKLISVILTANKKYIILFLNGIVI